MAFEDRIDLNRRISQTLEALARAIFKSWFVDLNLGGGPSGTVGRQETGLLTDVAAVERELLNPSTFHDEVFDHYSIPAYDLDRRPAEELGRDIRSSKFVVPSDSVLISKLNPRIPRIWLPFTSTARRSISSTEFVVLRPRRGFTREFMYLLVSRGEFAAALGQMVRGTSGSHQRVKADDLLSMRVPLPDSETVSTFTAVVSPMFELVRTNLANSLTLAELRDRLLQRLISGRLRVDTRG